MFWSTILLFFIHYRSVPTVSKYVKLTKGVDLQSLVLMDIQRLVAQNEVVISSYGYEELAADDIFVQDVLLSISEAVVVEDYPAFGKGPCVLVLQEDNNRQPVHVVWGIARGKVSPAVLITAYRPDPEKWVDDFTRRKK